MMQMINVEKNSKLCGCLEAYTFETVLIKETKSRLVANKNNLLQESLNENIENLEVKSNFDAAKLDEIASFISVYSLRVKTLFLVYGNKRGVK